MSHENEQTTSFAFTSNQRAGERGGDSNLAFNIELDTISRPSTDPDAVSTTSSARRIRKIYCGDGVVEEDEEEEMEKVRQEAEEKKKAIELRKKLDEEAKNLPWIPWIGYMTSRTAVRTLEAADYAGEKLAWWLGITQPKFLYEVEEYNRMKQEELGRNLEDMTEEIVIGPNNSYTVRIAASAAAAEPSDSIQTISRGGDVSNHDVLLTSLNERTGSTSPLAEN